MADLFMIIIILAQYLFSLHCGYRRGRTRTSGGTAKLPLREGNR